jgi:hypothetical protein
MIFSEKHHQVLMSLQNGNLSPETLSQSTEIDEFLVGQLLVEMDDAKFVKNYSRQREGRQAISQVVLLDKGKAALTSSVYFLGKSMNTASQDIHNHIQGDYIEGDKAEGDKIVGKEIESK